MNVPKILLISHGPPPSIGGAARVLYRLFKMLAVGSYVVLTTDFLKITDTDPKMKLPCKYYYAGLNPAPYTRWKGVLEWLLIPFMLMKCLDIIKKENINKILVHPSTGTFLLTAYLAHKITGIPLYLYMLDLYEESQRFRLRRLLAGPIERLVMHAATNVFVMSEAMQDYYFDKHNIATILLPHPIDLNGLDAKVENKPQNKQKHKIVFTGGMIYEAQINAIVNLVQAIKNVPEIEFHIYTRNTEEYLKKFGITGNNIIYRGYVDTKDILMIQKKADILFLPMAFNSIYPELIKAASPVKLPEYLVSGTPVLVHAPPYAYVSWYARKHGWGMVVDRPQPEQLKEALLKLISDKKLQQDLVNNARKTLLLHDSNRVFGILKEGLGITSRMLSVKHLGREIDGRGLNVKAHNGSRSIYQHFVITTFNVYRPGEAQKTKLRLDKSWLKRRFKLFDQFCFPSVRGQSNQNFKWLVLFDINTPDVYKRKIKKYSKWENFIPVYANEIKIPREMISHYLKDETEYLITTRLDNDDALCKDFVQIVQNYFDKQKLQFLNFTNGYIWKNNEIYLDKQPSNPFATLIEKVDEFKTVKCIEHDKIKHIGPVMEIMTKPAWIQVVHKDNISNRVRGTLQPPKKIKYLGSGFEIRKNLFLLYWIGTGFYFVRQILDRTRKTRHSLGLSASQLTRFREKLVKVLKIIR